MKSDIKSFKVSSFILLFLFQTVIGLLFLLFQEELANTPG